MQRIKELFYKGVFDNKTEKEIYQQARGISKQELQRTIAQLLEEKEIEYTINNRLRIRYLAGKLQGNKRGFAFFIPEDGGQDLFIKQENLNGAIHGDQVLVKKIGGKKGDEAVVVKLVKRNTITLVGQYFYSKMGGKVTPDDNGYAQDIYIENYPINIAKKSMQESNSDVMDSASYIFMFADRQEKKNQMPIQHAIQGEKVVVRITRQTKDGQLYGRIEKVLGYAGEIEVEENAILAESQLPQEFSQNCLNYAEKISKQKINVENRLDLRNSLTITIDGDDSRDYDDAVSITREQDTFILGVHIADVTHYVKRGDLLDIEAYERGTSVYLPDRVLPMLPPQLSNGACSLNEGEDKYTLSCIMRIDKQGNVIDYKIANSVICSSHRMTYKQVTRLLALENCLENIEQKYKNELKDEKLQEQYAAILPMCKDFAALTKILIEKRKNKGSIDLDIEESQIIVDEGKIVIEKYERTFAHRMIEEAMILANETVAQFVEKKKLPFVYRVHENPAAEKVANLLKFLQGMGIRVNMDIENIQSHDYANILKNLQNDKLQSIVHRVMLRSMCKARYSHINCGHFGLASSSYTHFTSPIRRYPDLLIHRIIKHILNGEEKQLLSFKLFVERASEQSSLRERRAEECERHIEELYKVFYMQQHIGQTFVGTISGVTNFAIFVELENSIEGQIKVENLPQDSYIFMEEKLQLKGTKHSYTFGDSIKIQVMRCDIKARKIEFLLDDINCNTLDKSLKSRNNQNEKNRLRNNNNKKTGQIKSSKKRIKSQFSKKNKDNQTERNSKAKKSNKFIKSTKKKWSKRKNEGNRI